MHFYILYPHSLHTAQAVQLKRLSAPGSHSVKLQFLISWFPTTRGDEISFAAKRSRASPSRNERIAVASHVRCLHVSVHHISNWLLNIAHSVHLLPNQNIHLEVTPFNNQIHLATSMDISIRDSLSTNE